MSTNTIAPQAQESTEDRTLSNEAKPEHFRTPWVDRYFWVFATVLLMCAVISRFWDLGDKPYHHDESLHAYYSHRVANGNVHEYSALLHGPFLYYFVGAFLFLAKTIGAFTSNIHLAELDTTARIPAAAFGVLVVAIPLLARRLLGNLTTLVLMALLLISPTTLYFGRFLREDVFTSIWVLGTIFGLALWFFLPPNPEKQEHGIPTDTKSRALYFAAAMMAFHFTNKENAYLHAFLWILALIAIPFVSQLMWPRPQHNTIGQNALTTKKSLVTLLASAVIFSVIYVVFYSSFFQHSKGWWNGVLDGLYRESLVYWWNQNSQRRIDGPFDYYLPIIANYEFLLLPFLASAWVRLVLLSSKIQEAATSHITPRRFFLTRKTMAFVVIAATAFLGLYTSFGPRVALVREACEYTEIPCSSRSLPSVATECKAATGKPAVCALHVAHSRHILQILSYLVVGAVAFFCALHLCKRTEAFLWFWFTGALGIYSYVGEKVPWLTIYILLPLLLIAGTEISRILGRNETPVGLTDSPNLDAEKLFHKRFSSALFVVTIAWLACTIPFTAFKGWRAAFPNAANPAERLVFTQTTPEIKTLRDRWVLAAQRSGRDVHVAMDGEATWPVAWYVQRFKGFDFVKPTPQKRHDFDVIFVNDATEAAAKSAYPDYNMYRVPLRAWWVPGVNPTYSQIFDYFFNEKLYPVRPGAPKDEDGKGATYVLYLESAAPGSLFANLPPLQGWEMVSPARR